MVTRRIRVARAMLWVGAIAAFIYTVGRSVDEVGGVGPLEVVRGVGGIALLLLSYLVAPVGIRRLRLGFVEYAAVAFVVLCGVSAIWSFDARITLLRAVPLAGTYLCCLRLVRLYESPLAALAGLVTLCHTILLVAGVQFFVMRDEVYGVGEESWEIARFHTALPSIGANLLGLVIAIAALGIVLRIGPRWTYRPLAGPVLVAVYGVMLIAGRSRMVTAIGVIMLLVALLMLMRRNATVAVLGWLGIGVFLCVVFWILQTPSTQASLVDFVLRGQEAENLSTLTGRTTIWDLALVAWEHSPILGYGYYAGHRLALPTMFPLFANYSNIDNTWLETLVNGGIVTTATLGLYVFAGLVRVLRSRADAWGGPSGKMFALMVSAAVVALSFVNPGIQTPSTSLIAFAILVFSAADSAEDHRTQTYAQRGDRPRAAYSATARAAD